MSQMSAPRGGARLRFLGLAALVALADQLVKALVVHHMVLGASRRLLGSLVSLTRESNTGAAFGMFSWASAALSVAGALVVILLVIWGVRSAACHPGHRAVHSTLARYPAAGTAPSPGRCRRRADASPAVPEEFPRYRDCSEE